MKGLLRLAHFQVLAWVLISEFLPSRTRSVLSQFMESLIDDVLSNFHKDVDLHEAHY